MNKGFVMGRGEGPGGVKMLEIEKDKSDWP